MDLVGLAEVVSAIAVLVGFGFAISEVRRARERKARESALELVRSYQTPDFAHAIMLLGDLPDSVTKDELEKCCREDLKLVSLLLGTWESLGVLTFRREVSLDLVCDFFSGPIVLSWRKVGPMVEEMRKETGRQTLYEWFQWLAERVLEFEEQASPIPAHIEHRRWRLR